MRHVLRDLWWLAQSVRRFIILGVASQLIIQSLALALAYSLSILVDTLNANLSNEAFQSRVTWLFIVLASLMLIERSMRWLNDHIVIRVLFWTYRDISIQVHEHMLRLSLGYHESESTGHKRKKIERGIAKTIDLVDNWGFNGIPTVTLLAVSLLILYIKVHWVLGLIMTLAIPPFLIIAERYYRRSRPWRRQRHDLEEDSESHIVQGIQNITTVQAFHRQSRELLQLRDIWKELLHNGLKGMWIIIKSGLVRGLMMACFTLSVLLYGVYLARSGIITLGEFLLAGYMLERIGGHIWALGHAIDRTMRDSDAIHRLREMIELKPEIVESRNPTHLRTITQSIEFDGVTFTYPTRTEPALQDVSTTIPVGAVTALVGPSGSGKSTFVKMLFRAYDPQLGAIRIDGHDLRNLELSYRKRFGLVTQQSEIFDMTIRENIAYGRDDITEEQILEAARIAHVDEFVAELKNGYDTEVGEKGVRLSGGQQQRLAIARAIAADGPVLVFDEATSHLDAKSERYIQEALTEVARNRTVIVIAHRLSTVRRANKIIVFSHGQIVESGNHRSLMTRPDGVYRELIELQHDGLLAEELQPREIEVPTACEFATS